MNPDDVTLSTFDSFGDVAAEDDAVLEYFLSTNAVKSIADGKAFLVLGRKGTGKTAIVRHFTEGNAGRLSRSLNLRGYPWSVHERRIDYGASEIEAYVSSWRYLLAVKLAALVLSHSKSSVSLETPPLRKFLRDNYGGADPQLTDVLRPARLSLGRLSLKPSIMGNALGGVDLDRDGKDHRLGLELNALSTAIMQAVYVVAEEAKTGALSLHFDELDAGLSRLDESRSKMIIGLVLAARELRREGHARGVNINPVVYLRTDLWDDLEFSDKNKISQTLTLFLEWNSNSLRALVDARLKAKLGHNVNWENVVEPDLMRGSQKKWNHILARTFERPRDVISFLNICLKETKLNELEPRKIRNKDVVNSREAYSTYLKPHESPHF